MKTFILHPLIQLKVRLCLFPLCCRAYTLSAAGGKWLFLAFHTFKDQNQNQGKEEDKDKLFFIGFTYPNWVRTVDQTRSIIQSMSLWKVMRALFTFSIYHLSLHNNHDIHNPQKTTTFLSRAILSYLVNKYAEENPSKRSESLQSSDYDGDVGSVMTPHEYRFHVY